MKFTRNATAVWKGSGKEGKGNLSTESGALDSQSYSFGTRFDNKKGTNPEELVAAAHAGCFSMKLSFLLGDAGFTPEEIVTTAAVTIEDGNVSSSKLNLTARVSGIDEAKFQELAKKAKETCPISQLLKADIELVAKLK